MTVGPAVADAEHEIGFEQGVPVALLGDQIHRQVDTQDGPGQLDQHEERVIDAERARQSSADPREQIADISAEVDSLRGEIDSLRDAGLNPQAAAVYQHATQADLIAGVEIRTFHYATRLAGHEPKSLDEFSYAIAFPVAAMIVRGRIGVERDDHAHRGGPRRPGRRRR